MFSLFDTNVLINLIRTKTLLPSSSVISIITVGELKAFAVKRNWGYQKRATLEQIFGEIPILGIELSLTDVYTTIDAYSQGSLASDPLPSGITARNMGKNDIWIVATALF